jgi:hypothetical protein
MTKNNTPDFESGNTSGISRRTVTKAMAWSVPVIAVAATVPTATASPTCLDSGVCFGGVLIRKDCGNPDTRNYWACVTFTNNSNTDVEVSFDFLLVTSAQGDLAFAGGGTVPANQTCGFLVQNFGDLNCSNGTYDPFNINFTDGNSVGSAPVPGGSTGGNTTPTCPGCS